MMDTSLSQLVDGGEGGLVKCLGALGSGGLHSSRLSLDRLDFFLFFPEDRVYTCSSSAARWLLSGPCFSSSVPHSVLLLTESSVVSIWILERKL